MINKKAFTFAHPCHSVASAEESSLPARENMTSIDISDLDCHGEPKCYSRLAMTYSAFTFAELMVSLVIIAVITALLYPTIAEISPNNNKQLYRSAYKTVELTVQDIITSNTTFSTPHDLCVAFKDRLNTVGWSGSAPATGGMPDSYQGCGDNSATEEELHTSNGMRWWFQNYNDGKHTIYVDVNASNNGNNFTSQQCDSGCTSGQMTDPNNFCNGNNSTLWKTGCFRTNNSTTRDTFKIQITDDGKVISDCDSIGARHLRDETE